MKLSRIAAAALASAALPSAFALGTTSVLAAPSPVDNFVGATIANPPDAASITRRCDAYIGEIERQQRVLERETGRATIERTLQRYDDISMLLRAGGAEFTLYREVAADAERRAAGAACEVRMDNAESKLSLSRPIYDRLKAIDATRADPSTQHYLKRTLLGFERSGVSRDPATRAKVQALQEKIAVAGNAFDRNIAEGRRTIKADPAELAGLPADYIAAHPPGPDGKVTISTDYPDYAPVMTYAESDDLRKRLLDQYLLRAFPENDAKLRELFDLRHELATLLGRPDYAALELEDKMLDTPQKVETLLAEMAAAARPAGERDYAKKLAVWQQKHPGATSFPLWANSYLGQKVQKQLFDYDRQEARKYFTYNGVRDGVLRLTEDLFGLEIRKWDTPVWDPAVETYEIVENGAVIGRFYLDSHPRPGKYSHANHIAVRSGVEGRMIPVSALVMNLPAGDHTTGLMEHGDVVTFLHEFGHLLHSILGSKQKWVGNSYNAVEWDFIEAPSQMLEEWLFDYDTLARFAVDAEGRTIPRELVEKMNKARYFDLGLGDLRQLGLANASLGFHRGPAPADIGATFRRLEGQFDPIGYYDGSQMQSAFTHLNGYSTVYYTYRWSMVIAKDLFTRFKQNGLRDRATAARYREKVLEPGGSKPAAQLVEDFLGRPVSIQAYTAEMAKDL
jgi:thimet oligopeptidase